MSRGLARIVAAGAIMAAAMAAALPAYAQIPPSARPGRERDIIDNQLPTARAQPGGPAIRLPSTVAPPGADRIMLRLAGVQVTGSTIYSAEQLAALYSREVGQEVSLAAVYDIAQRITGLYGHDGYVLTRAIVPPQELTPRGAVIHIQVIEGYIDDVVWPKELSSYRDFFSYYTARIVADRPANIRTLERYLLLAGDLPGLKFKNSLKPSATKPGAATMVVEVERKLVDALARFDNRGTQERGPLEYLASATFNNLMHMHEALTLSYAGVTQTRELQYVSAAYRQVLTPEGLTFFVDGSDSGGHPGLPINPAFHYKTQSAIVETGVSYPFIRQRERNITGTALVFASDDRGVFFNAPSTPPSNHNKMRGIRVKVDADLADEAKGINTLDITISHGFEGFGSSLNGSPLLIPLDGRVDFTKLEVTGTRLQQLYGNLSFLAAAYGQYAFTRLLSSEQCGYGGRAFGRAYDPSELLGDSCWMVLGELRADMPIPAKEITQSQLYTFVDRGRVYNHNVALNSGTRANVDGASVGGGYRIGWLSKASADLQVAKAFDGPRDDWRFFFILAGRY
jgi:hemolysin activation/secretion protein